MTDTTDTPSTEAESTVADGEGPTAERSGLIEELTWPEVQRKLQLAAILGLALLAAWAAFQVYLSLSRAIAIWLSADYVPLFQAVFNAAVVTVAIAGILGIRRALA